MINSGREWDFMENTKLMKNMYSLNNPYYNKYFSTIADLIDDVLATGMDPSYEITKNGNGIGENLSDYLEE